MDTIVPSEGAVWFGLQRQTDGGIWQRCERPDWTGQERWWRVAELDPRGVAQKGFGDGVFRAIWSGEDRRAKKRWKFSDPFEVASAGSAVQPPSPAFAGVPGAPYVPMMPYPPFANTHTPPPVVPHVAHAVSHLQPEHPMALFYALHAVYRDDRQGERERDLQMFTMMLEAIRSQGQVALHQVQQFNSVLAGHQSAMTAERRELEAQAADARLRPLREQLENVNARLMSLAQTVAEEDDDDEADPDDVTEAALARMGENPTDAERVVQGIASIMQTVSTFAQTPVGEALAKRIMGRIDHVHQPVPHAAE